MYEDLVNKKVREDICFGCGRKDVISIHYSWDEGFTKVRPYCPFCEAQYYRDQTTIENCALDGGEELTPVGEQLKESGYTELHYLNCCLSCGHWEPFDDKKFYYGTCSGMTDPVETYALGTCGRWFDH